MVTKQQAKGLLIGTAVTATAIAIRSAFEIKNTYEMIVNHSKQLANPAIQALLRVDNIQHLAFAVTVIGVCAITVGICANELGNLKPDLLRKNSINTQNDENNPTKLQRIWNAVKSIAYLPIKLDEASKELVREYKNKESS